MSKELNCTFLLIHFSVLIATYEEARHKAAKAKNGDAKLTSDPDDYGKGKRKDRFDNANSSDEDEPSSKFQKMLEIIPQLPPSSQASCSRITAEEQDEEQSESLLKDFNKENSSPLLFSPSVKTSTPKLNSLSKHKKKGKFISPLFFFFFCIIFFKIVIVLGKAFRGVWV